MVYYVQMYYKNQWHQTIAGKQYEKLRMLFYAGILCRGCRPENLGYLGYGLSNKMKFRISF